MTVFICFMGVAVGIIFFLIISIEKGRHNASVSLRHLEDKIMKNLKKCEELPNNHILKIITEMYAKKLEYLNRADPRYFRSNCIPAYCDDVGMWCRVKGIKWNEIFYPDDWEGIRITSDYKEEHYN